MKSPHIAALYLALLKGDLVQKEELEKTKNWLVGDEKGVKYAEVTLSPYDKGTTAFQTNPKVKSTPTDVLHLALGKQGGSYAKRRIGKDQELACR